MAGAAAGAGAQQPPAATEARLRAQREELDRIRRERDELQRRLQQSQGRIRDLSQEVQNLERQADATARAVRSLDQQLALIDDEVRAATADLVRAEDELVAKRAQLQRRLVDIYKRGALYEGEALLSASSFGELVARYKYLRLIALRDRALVRRVEQLRDATSAQRAQMVRLHDDLEFARRQKAEEERRLRDLEAQRERSLAQARRTVQQTTERLAQIRRDEARLNAVIGELEAARRRAEALPNAPRPAASTLRTSDIGRYDWPVEGAILYRFGRVVNPNNTTTRWNGIGIGAAAGTPVRAIAAGTVVSDAPIGTYGNTVIVQHGGGDYSVYGSLQAVQVRKGMAIQKGQVIGTVGTADPDLGPHLHLEIRPGGRAVDPLEWLRTRP